MLFLNCLVLREANKCNAQKSCGANCIRVKFTLRKSYPLINLKLFFSRPEGFLYIWCMFCHSDHNVTLSLLLFRNRTCSCSVSHTNADVLAECCSVCVTGGLEDFRCHTSSSESVASSDPPGTRPLQKKPNPSRVVFHCSRGILRDECILRIPMWICEQWGQ